MPSGDTLLGALLGAAYDLCGVGSRLPDCRVLAYRDSLPPGLVGVYVPVLDAEDSIHIGILSDVCSCDALARMFDETAGRSELRMRTAISQLARDLARGLARRAAPLAQLVVGAPVFVDGVARRTRGSGVRAAEVVFGITRATLVLIGSEALVQSDWPGADTQARSRREEHR
jgi:hypothetical protein